MTRILFALTLLSAVPVAAEPISKSGSVTAVTVYQGQALVTREVALDRVDGLAEVVVTNLPLRVTPGSLYAEPVGDLEVRSVRYRVRPVAEDTREEIQQLDEEIQSVRDDITAVGAKLELLKSRTNYLTKLENFTTKTASHELTQGVLDATTLNELTKTIFVGREEVASAKLELDKEGRELNKRLALLNNKRKRMTSASSRSEREAVVFVNAPKAGAANLRLTYLVSGATWSPSYNLRASEDRDKVVVEYNASIQQQSGEDWSDVEMTLSTASPSLVAAAPSLDPLAIRLGAAPPPAASGPQRAKLAFEETREQLVRQQQSLSKSRRGFTANAPADAFGDLFGADESGVVADGAASRSGRGFGGEFGGGGLGGGGFGAAYGDFGSFVARADRSLNLLGNKLQVFECASPATAAASIGARQSKSEGISVVYRLANRTSLPSRPDQQLLPIARLPLDGEFYRVARPLLTEFVYEQASVINDTDFVLLSGPAATFLGDRFVGRGAVPTVAVGEPFAVGLGIDESLRAGRELVKKTRRLQGGNRIVRLDYRMTIENFGDESAEVRVFDRLPKGEDAEIKVSLLESDPTLTTADDKDKKQGILRWDIKAPAKNAKSGEATIQYAMQLEYDKNRTIIEAQADR